MIQKNIAMEAEINTVFSASAQNKLEQIKIKIGLLIQLYVSHQESFIAEAVAEQIGEILVDPDYINDFEQRCLYRQLEMHWRCLGWISNTSSSSERSLMHTKSSTLRNHQLVQ